MKRLTSDPRKCFGLYDSLMGKWVHKYFIFYPIITKREPAFTLLLLSFF
jgi:hypothetical protein